MRRLILAILSAVLTTVYLSAQESEPADSLVRLMSAKSVVVVNQDGNNSRKVFGPANFLHNNTTLLCDTAFWWVDSQVINAFGNVQIIQEGTTLKSDKLDYYVDRNVAEFRGSVVQLKDKDNNILRTRHLDYNTKDSVAVFTGGASMMDKDGQLIESIDGTYDSKIKLFTFANNVNMFSDSVFVRTDSLKYHGNINRADFDTDVDIVKNQYHVFAKRGVYTRADEKFRLFDSVHGISNSQEMWSDTLVFDRTLGNLDLYGNIQIIDTTRGTTSLGRRLHYEDSIRTITLSVEAAVVLDVIDSAGNNNPIYAGADVLKLAAVKKNKIPESETQEATKRLSDMMVDPVGELRKKAAEEAKSRAEQAARERDEKLGKRNSAPQAPAPEKEENVPEKEEKHETEVAVDSLAQVDTSDVHFITALNKVKIYRSDMQVLCDSLEYTTLDSIVRMYVDPIIWNEANRQYSADVIFLSTDGNRLEKANLMENAFVIIQEDSSCFDQIHSTEMMAYFDSTSALQRFDALGGASAVFFIEENDALATVNKVDTKMLSATFKDNEIQSVHYFESPKSDAYPVVQLDSSGKVLGGFKWRPELRPMGLSDMTSLSIRPSAREELRNRPGTDFKYTKVFFSQYINQIFDEIETRKKASFLRGIEFGIEDDGSMAFLDSLGIELADTVAIAEKVENKAEEDTASAKDSTSVVKEDPKPLTKKEIAAKLRAEKLAARKKAKEERWEKKDLRDSLIQARKDAKALEKKRRAIAKKYRRQLKEDAENQRYYERYYKRFESRYKVTPDSGLPELQPQDSPEEQTPSSHEN